MPSTKVFCSISRVAEIGHDGFHKLAYSHSFSDPVKRPIRAENGVANFIKKIRVDVAKRTDVFFCRWTSAQENLRPGNG